MTVQDSFAGFVTTEIEPTLIGLLRIQGFARERHLDAVGDLAAEIVLGLLNDLNATAAKFAARADEAIVAKIHASHTANRPVTGNMETHIHSAPDTLGRVRVALIEELDRIVNPDGWGTFWQAQEFGTGTSGMRGQIPTQIGRPLVGVFQPSGTVPDRAQRGLNVGSDLAYIPGGLPSGLGVISVDLPGRHFLRDGAIEAGAEYIAAMSEVQTKWLQRIDELIALIKRQGRGGGGRFIGRIQA